MSENSLQPVDANKTNRKLLYWFLLALLIALLPWLVLAQTPPIKKEKFHFDEKSENVIGYAQAVRVGNTIHISGTVAGGPMEKSIKSVYDDLEKTLKAYNATFKNVVKENVFTTDIEAFKKHSAIRNAYYQNDFPAASWIQIQQLYDPSLNLEVELIAILKDDD